MKIGSRHSCRCKHDIRKFTFEGTFFSKTSQYRVVSKRKIDNSYTENCVKKKLLHISFDLQYNVVTCLFKFSKTRDGKPQHMERIYVFNDIKRFLRHLSCRKSDHGWFLWLQTKLLIIL